MTYSVYPRNASNKIQNGDVLVLANPDPSGKWPLKLQRKFRVNISKIQIKNAHWTKMTIINLSTGSTNHKVILDNTI